MGAPKGNQYWKLADPESIGRPRNFETPNDLWLKCKEYFEWVDNNPILKTDFKGKDSDMVQYDLQRPYTWEGLYTYLGVCDISRYKEKKEFVDIITYIGNVIKTQKFEGAAVGIFNQNIIARDLGLVDRSDHTTNGKEINIPVIKWEADGSQDS